tara:strand:- start:1800 stop:2480 length:681 start_codon:yes stop_codon:yes gene_type:complete
MNTVIIILLSIITISFFNEKSLYAIIIFTILYFGFNYYKEKVIRKEIPSEKKDITISEEGKLITSEEKITDKKEVIYNTNIENVLKKISKYSKYNINDYNNGLKYLNEFLENIKTLENKNLKHSKHYIENAQLYLKKSINHFQYITTSMNDSNYLDKVKYNDYKDFKKSNKLSDLIKELYKICYSKLYNIIDNHNINFDKNPTNYNMNINVDEPEPYNNINSYEMY